ncbi:hypothetical protein AZF37_09400 [endosymbiont 'TC1' of Trimyema compressum]|uniref:hypothetical protein n=1 Tax=endosymbiont 'TC1' of Trimyema compressum TaxID=243899 RepID=UPI0007F126BF|nr:hypothetical protein [endosymbiont 'TC1' of Trimyema compressum]AMP21332.1 hypothetical protein AZF37_09400 [endosymbiont 'TC1' of Trimyema compressum]
MKKLKKHLCCFLTVTLAIVEKAIFIKRGGIKALLDGGLYDKALTVVRGKRESFLKEDRAILESFLLYISNHKKDWLLAESIIKAYTLEEPHDLILKEIINYNQGKLNIESIDGLLSYPSIREKRPI